MVVTYIPWGTRRCLRGLCGVQLSSSAVGVLLVVNDNMWSRDGQRNCGELKRLRAGHYVVHIIENRAVSRVRDWT